jgi:hypothetical protein
VIYGILFTSLNARLPAVLQTCQETRELGRRYYIAQEQGSKLRGSTVVRCIEKNIRLHMEDSDTRSPAPFDHILRLPRTKPQKAHILCAKNDLIHFLPFDERLRKGPDISTRIINVSGLDQNFVGIKYLAISLPNLVGWLYQCDRSRRIFFSAVDVLFALGNEKDGMEKYGIKGSCYPNCEYSSKAMIVTRCTMFVGSLEAAMVEVERIISKQEATVFPEQLLSI